MSRTQKSVSPAIELVGRVLREQGLGRHIDQDFIAAATTEMQEAMGMTPTEFEAAAAALLAAETEGAFREDCVQCKGLSKPWIYLQNTRERHEHIREFSDIQ